MCIRDSRSQVRTRRPQRLPRGSVSRINASLAFHAIVNAAEVSAVSHHPSLCMRRGGGGTSAATASRITLVKDSAISEILLGCKGGSGSLEMIRAATRCLQSPSDRNFCRSKGWVWFFVRMRLLGAMRSLKRTLAYMMLRSESVLAGEGGWGLSLIHI